MKTLTRAQKISATKKAQAEQISIKQKEYFASLTVLEKLQKRVQRNPRLLDLCHEIDNIVAHLSILISDYLKNKSIDAKIESWNKTHLNNKIKFDPYFGALVIEYSSTELKNKFGHDGYKLWRSCFKQLSKRRN